jgi:hypothetical protein
MNIVRSDNAVSTGDMAIPQFPSLRQASFASVCRETRVYVVHVLDSAPVHGEI